MLTIHLIFLIHSRYVLFCELVAEFCFEKPQKREMTTKPEVISTNILTTINQENVNSSEWKL